jgi:peptidyl-prolyl cis-trans isomerase D
MTMLDRMRRHKGWLKWSLALVCLAFVVFYVPDFLSRQNVGAAPGAAVAAVDGRPITVDDFRRAYFQRLDAYRAAYGDKLNANTIRQLGLDRQILQQLVDEEAMLVEAERLGIKVGDVEVRERIVTLPGLQENGQFIGEERYRRLLRMQRPPLTPAAFEAEIGKSLMGDKLRTALTSWITVSDAEADREYRRRNEKAKLEVASLPADRLREGISVTDAELAAHFNEHKNDYRFGEKRRIRFLSIDLQGLRAAITVPSADIERYYNENRDQFSTPERVRASHILLKTEGKNEADVRKQATDLLTKIKAGADFAALAKAHSEDTASQVKGGDLDYFPRGQMVKEFEDVAFGLAPGQTSDVVKSPFGFHIIRVVDKQPALMKPLADVRDQIGEQLKWERAQGRADTLAVEMAKSIRSPADLENAARQHGLKVQDSNFFQRDELVQGLGPAPEVVSQAFTLAQGKVAGPVRTAQGHAFFAVTGIEAARVPRIDEVKERVREDVTRAKAIELAKSRAAELASRARSGAGLTAAAKAAGFTVTTADHTRGAAVQGVGNSPAIDEAAFALPVGRVSEPIVTDSNVVLVRVAERTEIKPEDLQSNRESMRSELLNERRGRFLSSYMEKAKGRMNITTYADVVQKITNQ